MVAENLVFEGKKYVLSRVAARLTKYSNDYVGELCRAGKVKARQIGKLWYIEKESLLEYKSQNGKQGFGAQKIINARKETPYESPFVSGEEKSELIPPIEKKVGPSQKLSHLGLQPSPFAENNLKIKNKKLKIEDLQNLKSRLTSKISSIAVSKIATLALAFLISTTGYLAMSGMIQLPSLEGTRDFQQISLAEISKNINETALSLSSVPDALQNIFSTAGNKMSAVGKSIGNFFIGDIMPPPTVFVRQEESNEFKKKIIRPDKKNNHEYIRNTAQVQG